jgi:hypothetical protein
LNERHTTNLRIHATHSALLRKTTLTPGIVYTAFFWICQDLVPGVHISATIYDQTKKMWDGRMGYFLEKFGVTTLVWVQSQSSEQLFNIS